jgi:xanthine dehydrogenase accessory factor
MRIADLAATVQEWLAEGMQVAVAWPVAFAGFSSRRSGEVLAMADNGQQAGEVLGNRVTAELATVLARHTAGGLAPSVALMHLPVDKPAAVAAGLACAGTVTVALHQASTMPPRFWQAVAAGEPIALVTRLGSEETAEMPASLLAGPEGATTGSLGSAELNTEGANAAWALLTEGRTSGRVIAIADGTLVVEAVVPAARLVVVGGGDLAEALERQATLLGWQPDIVEGAGHAEAIPELGPGDGVVVLTHDHDIGVPVLAAALRSRAGYIGALGSRGTQAARRAALAAAGVDETSLGRIHGPAGLDLGGRAPEEIALAICAEMLAKRSGRDGGALRERRDSIHG